METNYIREIFESKVFNDAQMQARLPQDIYQSLRKTIREGKELDSTVAKAVAAAMCDWAMEQGATHFTHWFQPLTGITAEKHDSFLSLDKKGEPITSFSAKELIRGESDASSFPSGGLRATFEARGYTAWDPTSYAFIKDDSLCIPTVFCSYGGEMLDKKTPLLRSMEVLNTEALRILRLFGLNDVTRVTPSVGAEQEYFLVDKALASKRKDLLYTGRTLFGAKPPRGQENVDHYYSPIHPRVMAFMQELNSELWKLGVYAKTEHNEVAPGQHELAPIFASANVETDHNQLTMEMLKTIAGRHGFLCLLHEKPFRGLNGSGKHNNWSLMTDTGLNLLKPGKEPQSNKLFLLMLCAVLRAVDEHQDLLRISIASASNDQRLGGNEAPPAILSVFLGDALLGVLQAVELGKDAAASGKTWMGTGVSVLPELLKDTTDRNRTSPFAFTGNKFEFRSPGSAASIADVNMVLNTAVADVLRDFADRLDGAPDFDAAVQALLAASIRDHGRIIFNGNNYTQEWRAEAKRRGLLELPSVPDALPCLIRPENVAFFTRNHILNKAELVSRYEIMLDTYCKATAVEAQTLLEMLQKEICPAVSGYRHEIADTLISLKTLGVDVADCPETALLQFLNQGAKDLSAARTALDVALLGLSAFDDTLSQARFCRDALLPAMDAARAVIDRLEPEVSAKFWTLPTYDELLFQA